MLGNDSRKKYSIGLDIGGTKTLAALIDESGRIVHQILFPTQLKFEDSYEQIYEAIITLKKITLNIDGQLLGIGIACAGVVDTLDRKIVYVRNLDWANIPIGDKLTKDTGLQVKIGNDANLAAVAEYVWGTVTEENLIYITISTGVGAGIISSGRLIRGSTDNAGEFGHISTNPFGPRCRCGNYGCLENYSSGTAIAAVANELVLHNRNDWSTKEVLEAAEAGDSHTIKVVKSAGEHLGYGIITLIHLFNPKRIVLGGGVMDNGNLLLNEVKQLIMERCLPYMSKQLVIEKTQLGKEIGVLGASGMYFMN